MTSRALLAQADDNKLRTALHTWMIDSIIEYFDTPNDALQYLLEQVEVWWNEYIAEAIYERAD